MKTIIHVNQHNIKKNRNSAKQSLDGESNLHNGVSSKPNLNLPVLTVKTYKSNIYANRVKIHGPSEVVYSPDKPLSCGAHVWIETLSDVEILGESFNYNSFKDIKEQIA